MEKLDYMKEMLPFWNKITEKQRKTLMESAIEKNFGKGETLHAGSNDCSGLFLIKEGQTRVFILSEGGKEITLYRLFDRDLCLFSASCLFKNINFEVFIEAEKETSCFLIPTVVFQRISKESLPVTEYTNELLSSRFSDVFWLMEQVLFQSFDKRLAVFLLEQANIEGEDTFFMTQEKIAKHLGSAREVVSRMLKYFTSEGLITSKRGSITIINRKGLQKLAGNV